MQNMQITTENALLAVPTAIIQGQKPELSQDEALTKAIHLVDDAARRRREWER